MHEHAGGTALSERLQRVQERAARKLVTHLVTGEHEQVGAELGKPTHPGDLAMLPGRKVKVAQL